MIKRILVALIILSSYSCHFNNDYLVVGHRGAMGHVLENTLESVEKALELGVDGIEVDVFKSSTGEIVVHHDPQLNRLSNSNAFIERITLDSIKKIELNGGYKIPTLEEVIDLIPKNIFLNIELKGLNTAYSTNEIIEEKIRKNNFTYNNFIISSFRWDELEKFRSVNKKVPIAILVDSLNKIDNAILLAKKINANYLNPNKNFLTKSVVNKIKIKNLKVFPYTVNSYLNIKKMKSYEVDGIITDYPERINK